MSHASPPSSSPSSSPSPSPEDRPSPSSEDRPLPSSEGPDWIDRVVAVCSALGLNGVRVRWKLQGLQKRWRAAMRQSEQRISHVRYEHHICRQCGALQHRDATSCDRCGASMGTRVGHVLERLGVFVPDGLSLSLLLGAVLVIVYGRVALASHGLWLALPAQSLIHFGGSLPPGLASDEWWRPATSIFLHAGLWHLAFNLLALASVGPQVEQIYGRAMMLTLFLVTGVLASLGSTWMSRYGVGIGASGAIMGLVGVVAGHGHRLGTTAGRLARNAMLKWSLYVFVFGYFLGADNVAHVLGLLAGLVIGYAMSPRVLTAPRWRAAALAAGIVGVLGTAAIVVAVMVPLSKPLVKPLEGVFPGLMPLPADTLELDMDGGDGDVED
jgi:membrane associated rhomboid family serine protease/ribosomal protein L40E